MTNWNIKIKRAVGEDTNPNQILNYNDTLNADDYLGGFAPTTQWTFTNKN